ncbi:alpha/beta hydrolase [Piscinibacter aquaticus]|uniref:Alpha/beta hydrolase n=1 Tax=Piscinibacter aquaticus TaxID=392597 RepID=A0A5C6U4M5_9BURK|nr:alpha/beta hydrolase [Piscinibacter aquaticus]
MVHGSGGGHDHGMDWARPLTQQGIRVIAMSRFGYLRTPRPADASPEAQADAHLCLLDALGIDRAAVVGVSAGAASALQMALRHPDRVDALVLVVPIVWKPGSVADSAPQVSDEKDAWLLRLLGSDLLYWGGLQVARDQVFRHVLATPPTSSTPPACRSRRASTPWPSACCRCRSVPRVCATTRDWARACGPWRWSRSVRRRWSSVRATTASAPTPGPSTPPAASQARGLSATTAAGICW